ncbi:chemotaxis protein CheD [Halovenus aranensis]|jgi:chemotaxis protein CheD|uniref:Probable chemoreceptor glutamine deamidase CheD n=1 Tax=Halovenus aranensis TaxID=890420 RepID=A0A1G8RN00_9EURY|nr:chemotaxis protein CheD [Halovenus aranensis]SDJ18378.1 chemotaxis protein CheD [Halovenus aranensis]
MKIYDGSESGDSEETTPERIKVGIAEYEVTADGATLTTSGLGSCVGVALYDEHSGAAGLVHVMLPVADEVDDGKPAKFADTGTELLIEELESIGANKRGIEAKIAGGSDMLDFSEGGSGIGDRNVEQVKETLSDHNISLAGEDVGGDHGRSVRLQATTGDLVVKSANRQDRTL